MKYYVLIAVKGMGSIYLFTVMWGAPQIASGKSKEEKNVPGTLSFIYLKQKK